jgi:hypothetical protein
LGNHAQCDVTLKKQVADDQSIVLPDF